VADHYMHGVLLQKVEICVQLCTPLDHARVASQWIWPMRSFRLLIRAPCLEIESADPASDKMTASLRWSLIAPSLCCILSILLLPLHSSAWISFGPGQLIPSNFWRTLPSISTALASHPTSFPESQHSLTCQLGPSGEARSACDTWQDLIGVFDGLAEVVLDELLILWATAMKEPSPAEQSFEFASTDATAALVAIV
jgi:hypothetical protein